MASFSSSSFPNSFKYDVFLNFRGEDTRKNFVDHLYYALKRKGIVTYKDDRNIEKGKRINEQLIKSIEDSRFYIIVFSKNYASSSWCLDELVKIMECQQMTEHTAYPIFYDVEPTELRKQIGAVKDAFAGGHEKEGAAEKWRHALIEAAGLAGLELKNTLDGHEARFIENFVQKISLDLHSINFILDEELIGMETRIRDVVSSLEINVDDVRMLGIWGMGGAGKTTLARAVFDQISFQFEGKSVVENVREESKPSLSGLKSLQKQLLSDILNDQGVTVSGVLDGKNKIKKVMGGRKVLVVLDDVNHKDQLEALAGHCNWFNPGSRIIITTRDKQLLAAHGVELIHNVTLLSQAEADCLFSRRAFGRKNLIQGYEELSRKVLQYAGGLPLTIKVMGSHLRGLDESEWKNAIKRLETIPFKDTMKVLELSYDGLEEDCKQIFLDVACILKAQEKEYAIRVLESRGFYSIYGLRVLEQRSLITYDEHGRLGMHDHIEEMGRNIVCRPNPNEPQRHSRLWDKEEIEYILTNKLGTPATQCLKLWSSGFSAEIAIKGLAKMKDLKVLDIRVSIREHLCEMRWWGFDRDREYLPSSLRFMTWYYFPFSCLPNTFQGKHLVGLEMEWSNIVQLWEDGEEKVLYNLRSLRISRSKLRNFDLGLAPNLEHLTIQYCRDFVELHIPADHCLKLEHLDLDLTYSKLTNLHLGNAPNLKTLKLEGCYDLVELEMPFECLKLEKLYLRQSKLKTIHIGSTPNLMELILDGCNDLVELEMPAENNKLTLLYLCCSKLKTIHLGSTPNLEELILDGYDDLVELEKPVGSLKLTHLNLRDSKLKTIHLGSTPNLEELILDGCSDLVELEMPAEILKLTCLSLRYSKLKTINLGSTPNLEELILNGCNHLVELEMPSECLKLKELNLSHSKLTIIDLGLTPNLIRLNLENCYDLVEIKAPKDLGLLECLEELSFTSTRITHFPESIFMSTHLKSLKLKSCWHLEKLPEDLGRLECLEKLDLIECIYLRHIPSSICQLKSLKYFQLSYCFRVEKLPEEIGSLIQLEELNIEGTGISHLPQSIFQLKSLRIVGFTWQLQSYGFRSVIQTSAYVSFAYTSYHSSANHLEKQVFDFARQLQSSVNKNKRRRDY